jgi:pimeloyl-ACP methyl ester carboxylesterase
LSTAGLEVIAVDLPGRGHSVEPLADLHGDADAVTNVLDAIDGPVLLVGHSYGGAVVTEAGTHPRVDRLVYIAAFNLEVGECVGRAAEAEAKAAQLDHTGRPRLQDALVSDDGGEITTIAADRATPLFYNTTPQELADWAVPRLGRHRMSNFGQEVDRCGWSDRPSTYAVCTQDNAVHPQLQRILARRATDAVEWDTDHSPFLSRPDLVADLLVQLAGT